MDSDHLLITVCAVSRDLMEGSIYMVMDRDYTDLPHPEYLMYPQRWTY